MKKIAILAVSTILVSPCLYADSLDYLPHEGTYVELNAGTNLYYAAIFTHSGGGAGGIQGVGWSGGLGYHFKNRFGLEAGLMQSAFGKKISRDIVNVPYATTRFDIPLHDRFGLIGKLGVMAPIASGSGVFVVPFVGVGASYALTPKASVQLQYQGAVYGIAGIGLLSAGITYHFG